MWTQSTSVTDGRTDRITVTKTVQRIASHGKNEVTKAKIEIVFSSRKSAKNCQS